MTEDGGTGLLQGGHPLPEELDDLLSGALPRLQGKALREHLENCGSCAATADNLQRIRQMLAAQPPAPPMPDEVAERLASALAGAQAERSGAATATGLAAAPATGQGHGLRHRVRRGDNLRSRRQVREEERTAARATWLPRVLVAAAVVAILVLGGVAVTRLGQGGGPASTASGTSTSSQERKALDRLSHTPVLATGTDYQPAGLVEQVHALVTAAGAAGSAPLAAGGASSPGTSPTASGLASRAAPTSEPLSTPSFLAGCVTALGDSGQRPVAVDIATWQGRPAAIVVLPARTGAGYEVWAVARDCRPGADGTISFTAVPR